MTQDYKLLHDSVRNHKISLPPTGRIVHFDHDGISEGIDEETARETLTVPGYTLFEAPDTDPGDNPQLPEGTEQDDVPTTEDPSEASTPKPPEEVVNRTRGKRG